MLVKRENTLGVLYFFFSMGGGGVCNCCRVDRGPNAMLVKRSDVERVG